MTIPELGEQSLQYLVLQGVKIIMALVLSSFHRILGHDVSLSEKGGGGLLEERINTG